MMNQNKNFGHERSGRSRNETRDGAFSHEGTETRKGNWIKCPWGRLGVASRRVCAHDVAPDSGRWKERPQNPACAGWAIESPPFRTFRCPQRGGGDRAGNWIKCPQGRHGGRGVAPPSGCWNENAGKTSLCRLGYRITALQAVPILIRPWLGVGCSGNWIKCPEGRQGALVSRRLQGAGIKMRENPA